MNEKFKNKRKRLKLGEICSMKYGKMPNRSDLRKDGYPIFSGYKVVGFHKEYLYENSEIIVIARGVGGTGNVKLSPPRSFVTNLSIVLQIKSEEVFKKFLYFKLQNDNLRKLDSGSAQSQITISDLQNHEIEIPSYLTQKKTASILSAYDDLIELNERRIRILEEIARLIYREWFVKFRFPEHEKVRMVESELDLIPEGWTVRKFTEVVEINPPLGIHGDTSNPFVDMKDLSTESMVVKISRTKQAGGGSKFQNRDTLFARITPCLENGKIAFVQCLNEQRVGLGSTEFFVFRSKALCPEFVYLLARTNSLRQHAIRSMVGASGRQRVQRNCFAEYKLAIPSDDVLRKFRSSIVPLFESVQNLTEVNTVLRQTRDMLLPKLISGEMQV